MKQVADLRKGLCNPLIIGTIELLNWGCPNNSAPFELNLDFPEVFSWKTAPQKDPILVLFPPILLLIDPILLLIGGAQGTPWALSSLRLCTLT